MRKQIALATVLAALVGAAGATAHTTHYPSDISFDLMLCTDCGVKHGVAHHWVVGGEVSSAKAACVPGRKVKIYAVYTGVRKHGTVPPPAPELLDIDRTSEHGAWSARFTHTLDGVDHLEAQLVKRNIGPQGHSHICDGESAIRFLVM